jgi:hypothetical protein
VLKNIEMKRWMSSNLSKELINTFYNNYKAPDIAPGNRYLNYREPFYSRRSAAQMNRSGNAQLGIFPTVRRSSVFTFSVGVDEHSATECATAQMNSGDNTRSTTPSSSFESTPSVQVDDNRTIQYTAIAVSAQCFDFLESLH